MNVTDYCTLNEQALRFDAASASRFAKGVAGDFNPIHDPGSKRFCVPGDLLFSVLLARYGVFADTGVRFAGMLDADVTLDLPPTFDGTLHLEDPRGREILTFFGSGERYVDPAFIAALSRAYVQFSGATFPDILGNLMRESGIMINPERPLVIYKDMALRIGQPVSVEADSDIALTLAGCELDVNGKKGVANLRFHVDAGGTRIGEGEKNLVMSGLRAYEDDAMNALIADYESRRENYTAKEPGHAC